MYVIWVKYIKSRRINVLISIYYLFLNYFLKHPISFPIHVLRPFFLLLLNLGISLFWIFNKDFNPTPPHPHPWKLCKTQMSLRCFFVFIFHPGTTQGFPALAITSDTDNNPSKKKTTLPHWFLRHEGRPEPASLSLYKEFMHALRFQPSIK